MCATVSPSFVQFGREIRPFDIQAP